VAELLERLRFIDRNFKVQLTTFRLGLVPVRRTLFVSPDEGPPGSERLLWSKDGRWLLLLGANFYGTDDACLASGDVLYLLVDTVSGTVHSNATQTRGPRFTLGDLAGIDFGVTLLPGVLGPRYSRPRCVPPPDPMGAGLGR
jgi:hypothetical protein